MNASPEVVLERLARTQPSIGELIPQYVDLGISKERAVRYVVESHLASRNARGKGAKAAKREANELVAARERARDEFFRYAEKCEQVARRVFGVTKPTNNDRRLFLHVDSSGQRLEEF